MTRVVPGLPRPHGSTWLCGEGSCLQPAMERAHRLGNTASPQIRH